MVRRREVRITPESELMLAIAPWEPQSTFCERLALTNLDDEEQEILIRRFGLRTGQPAILDEIAEMLQVSRERARQRESIILRKLRSSPESIRILMGLAPSVVNVRQVSVVINRGEPRPPEAELDTYLPVIELELTPRAYNVLRKLEIYSVNELVKMTRMDLLKQENFGARSLRDVESALAAKGLRLADG